MSDLSLEQVRALSDEELSSYFPFELLVPQQTSHPQSTPRAPEHETSAQRSTEALSMDTDITALFERWRAQIRDFDEQLIVPRDEQFLSATWEEMYAFLLYIEAELRRNPMAAPDRPYRQGMTEVAFKREFAQKGVFMGKHGGCEFYGRPIRPDWPWRAFAGFTKSQYELNQDFLKTALGEKA